MIPEGSPSTVDRVATRALGTAGLRYASLLVGLVLSAVIARALGPEGRGQYYYPILVVLTLQAFLHLSLDPANVFLFSQRRAPLRDLVEQAGMFALITGVAGVVIGLAAGLALQDSLMAGVPLAHLALALAPLPLTLHTAYLSGLLLLQGRAVVIQAITLTGSAAQLAMMGSLVLGQRVTVGAVLAVNGLALLLNWGLTVRATTALTPVRPRWHPRLALQALRFGSRMHAGTVLYFLVGRLDAYLVKQLLGLTALGYYSLALSLADLVTVATDSLTAAVLPRQAGMELGEAARLTAKACRVTLALAACLSVGLALAAYPLVVSAYGRVFLPSIQPLLLLLPGVTILSMARPLGYYLLRLDRPLLSFAIIGVGSVFNLAFNLALIPRLGIAGAAVAASLWGLAMASCALAWFHRHSGLPLSEMLWLRRGDLSGVWSARRP